MTQMIVPAFRTSANPLRRPARLDNLARPAMQGLMLAALMLLACWLLTLALPTRLTLPGQTAPST